MTDEEIFHVRRLTGYMLLGAAGLVWLTATMTSPHGQSASAPGADFVKQTVAVFARNASLGTLLLVMLSAFALFWRRPPRRTAADLVPVAAMALLAATSFYQLVWIETEVLDAETQAVSEDART